jgi:hypothetical protein
VEYHFLIHLGGVGRKNIHFCNELKFANNSDVTLKYFIEI